jgi:hypothetical protein
MVYQPIVAATIALFPTQSLLLSFTAYNGWAAFKGVCFDLEAAPKYTFDFDFTYPTGGPVESYEEMLVASAGSPSAN